MTMEEEQEFQEQRVLMKFLVKAGKRNVEIHEMMTGVYGDHLVKTSLFFKRLGRFREGTKKAKMSKSKIKALLMIFFDSREIVLQEWVPQCQTVNSAYYLDVMKRLWERIREKRSDLWQNA